MSFYSNPNYWNQRYMVTANEKPCEWYRGYRHLRRFLDPSYFATKGAALKVQPKAASLPSSSHAFYFPQRDKCRVLILGCGNSTLGEEMMRDGWLGKIVNVDFSEVVISQMKTKYDDTFYQQFYGDNHALNKSMTLSPPQPPPKMEFLCADITEPFTFAADASFDLVISKGSFDAVLTGSKASIGGLVAEIHRVLAPGHGIFFLVTNGNPDSRLEYLEYEHELNYYWQGVSVHMVPATSLGIMPPGSRSNPQDKCVFAYICRKRALDQNADKENDESCLQTS